MEISKMGSLKAFDASVISHFFKCRASRLKIGQIA
jgi:hypothetical protein